MIKAEYVKKVLLTYTVDSKQEKRVKDALTKIHGFLDVVELIQDNGVRCQFQLPGSSLCHPRFSCEEAVDAFRKVCDELKLDSYTAITTTYTDIKVIER